MRAVFVLLALAAAPVLAQPEPDTTDWHRYAPLRVGDAWQYHEESDPPFPIPDRYRAYEVVGDTVINDTTWFEVLTCLRAWGAPMECVPETVLYRLDEQYARVIGDRWLGGPWDYYPCPLNAPFGGPFEFECGEDYPVQWSGIGVEDYGEYQVKSYWTLASAFSVRADVGLVNGGTGDPGCAHCFSLVYYRLDGTEYGTPVIIVGNETDAPASAAPALTVVPNPLRGGARLSFALDAPQALTIEVLDVRGRLLGTRPLGAHPAGPFSLPFDASTLAPGLYLLRVSGSGGFTASRGVIVQR
ncbi:MAG TPA: T9SS type A sorting domain-containing protein [Rubricoccaceae bacterium]|nr:T9SS type A sorting domain-containing protein [Rubricoccaceae bacterium]